MSAIAYPGADTKSGVPVTMPSSEGIGGSRSIMDELPSNYMRVHYHGIPKLRQAVQKVRDALDANGDGNQYILVLGLPDNIRQRLLDDDNPLGYNFRLALDGTSAVIKIPTAQHEASTDIMMGGATTHKMPGGQRAKQPEQCLWPAGRQPLAGNPHGWPTLVIETGVSESLSRLQEDARWWFENSLGETRIVVIMAINRTRRKIIIQKWQLAPAGTPSPLTRLRINQIRSQPPPRVQQAVSNQQPYSAQEVEISPAGISGAPLVLDFHAVFDRPPSGTETDITIPANVLLHCTRSV